MFATPATTNWTASWRCAVSRRSPRRAARTAGGPVPPAAGRRPPGADAHLPQLVRGAAAQRPAGRAAAPGAAGCSTTNCWRTTARPSRWSGGRFHCRAVARERQRVRLRGIVWPRMAARRRTKALEAALAKRVEFALADAQGVVDALGAACEARCSRRSPACNAPRRLLERRARTLAGWAQALGRREKQDPAKPRAWWSPSTRWRPDLDARLAQLRKAFFVADGRPPDEATWRSSRPRRKPSLSCRPVRRPPPAPGLAFAPAAHGAPGPPADRRSSAASSASAAGST
jgi:hypothetical protein